MDTNFSGFNIDYFLPKLEKFCSFQERCQYDVELKMLKLFVPEELKEKIINILKHRGFIDENRYTDLFVRSKINQNAWGSLKIKSELTKRRINNSLIDYYVSLYCEENAESNKLRLCLEKKNKLISTTQPEKQREKLIRYALSKGFSADLVFNIIKEFIKDKEY